MEDNAITISLKAEQLGEIWGVPITNALWVSFAITILLLLVLGITARRMKLIPGKFQLIIETVVGGMFNFVSSVAQNPKVAHRVFPLFATMALFFLASNLLGFMPGISALEWNGVAAYRPPTADYPQIFGITIVMFFVWQFVAIVSGGLVGYTKKFFNFSSPLNFAMGLLDIIGEIAKIISLSFRLFGNIFAGEAIAAVLLVLAPYVAPVPFSLLGLLSSVIQAIVFPILVLIFITMAIAVESSESPKKAS